MQKTSIKDEDGVEKTSLLGSQSFVNVMEDNPNTVQAERLGPGSRANLGVEAHAMWPTDIELLVPEKHQKGDKIAAQGPHGRVEFDVPDGLQPGTTFRYRLKAAPEFRIEVPPNALPGSSVAFNRPDGVRIMIEVPAGKKPGEQFDVTPPALMVLVPEGVQPGDFVTFCLRAPNSRDDSLAEWFRAPVPQELQLGKYFAARLPRPDPPQGGSSPKRGSPKRASAKASISMADSEGI